MRFREEEDVKTDRGFVEEDFGNGMVEESEFLVSLVGCRGPENWYPWYPGYQTNHFW